ncbi:hypothetical protein [Sulfuritalea sp.]|uniref:hypothetical protein n=1 Tax=Sulfuritalea sp. TaxID=2480090 RepID=UPI00286D6DAF|nr:hypothetical protein [Sulfuritalea sp.]
MVALAPVCTNCRSVITSVGGTLGLTGTYGVSDATITQRRVEADLAVLREYQVKYRGMKEACLQQLDWSVERYAKLPQTPELLALENVPDFWASLGSGLTSAAGWLFGSTIGSYVFMVVYDIIFHSFRRAGLTHTPSFAWIEHIPFFVFGIPGPGRRYLEPENLILNLFVLGGCVVVVLACLFPHFKAKRSNGDRPRENARRQKAHQEAVATALKAAEPLKAAEDHRLRVQIRELESCAKTVSDKEAEVRRLLPT